jgi:hypothetical protein
MRNAGGAIVVLAAVMGLAGCSGPKGAYGAETFIRINDTRGFPTYKASGPADDEYLGAEKRAEAVMLASCPDGHPHFIDGMGGETFGLYPSKPWWWATFTCDHEIPLGPVGNQ